MSNFRKYLGLFVFVLCLIAFLGACSSESENILESKIENNVEEFLSVLDQEGSVTGSVSVDNTNLTCGDNTDVTISLTGVNSITDNPIDIMLVLDRSGSMGGTPLANLKDAAKQFIDIIDAATDINSDTPDGNIDGGTRIGVVSFASSASLDNSLQTTTASLKTDIDGLSAGGQTNTAEAINLAQAQLTGSNPKVMILVTDGNPNIGDANAAASAAKGAGTEIFAIGFGGVSVGNLNNWASLPTNEHVFIAPDSSTLDDIFGDLAAALISPAGTNIEVEATVSSNFNISGVLADDGTAGAVGNVITWNIDELEEGTINLTFNATDIAGPPSYYNEPIFESITYTDDEGNIVTFNNPEITVLCPGDIDLEPDTAMGIAGFDDHTVTATTFYTDDTSVKIEGATVNFEVIFGPHTGTAGQGTSPTNVLGEATFTYSGVAPGVDIIEACFTDDTGELRCDQVEMLWKLPIALDIKPTSCRNPLQAGGGGLLPVAILGTADFDVTQIDISTIELEGVSPIRSEIEDVATPFEPFIGKEDPFDCTTDGADGFDDLTLKFRKNQVVAALGPINDGDVLVLTLTAKLLDGTVIIGEDVIVIID